MIKKKKKNGEVQRKEEKKFELFRILKQFAANFPSAQRSIFSLLNNIAKNRRESKNEKIKKKNEKKIGDRTDEDNLLSIY